MSSLNRAILIGRLGKDPEIRRMPDGKSVCNFSLATSEKFTDRAGQKQERTEWFNIVVFGKAADNVHQYQKKGSLVCVEGKIQTRSWEDKDGVKKYRTEIVAQHIGFLSSKQQGDSSPRPAADDDGFDLPPQADNPPPMEDDLLF